MAETPQDNQPAQNEKPSSKHKDNLLQRIAEEVEAHLIEGAELATSTSSAETNVALAALGAIEGPQVPEEPNAENTEDADEPSKPGSEAR